MHFWRHQAALTISGAPSRLLLSISVGLLASAGLLAACSAAPFDSHQPGPAEESPLSQDPAAISVDEPSLEEREAAFQEQLDAPLSESERAALEALLSTAGFREAQLEFRGRMLELGGDVHLDADDLLQEQDAAPQDTVPKGQVLSQVVTGGAPDLFARQVDAHTEFWRPDLDFQYMLIVDDAAPEFVMTMLQAAASAIAGAGSGDCLNSTTFTPIRRSAFDRIDSRAQAVMYRISVVYASNACSNSTAFACAQGPRLESHITQVQPPITQSRMRFGTRLGIASGKITSDTANNRGTLIHELLHLMGVMHPQSEQLDVTGVGGLTVQKIVVHGTQSGTNYLSVMHSLTSNVNWRNTLQADDIKVLLTLYSNYQDGRSPCGYFHGFRTPPLRL